MTQTPDKNIEVHDIVYPYHRRESRRPSGSSDPTGTRRRPAGSRVGSSSADQAPVAPLQYNFFVFPVFSAK